MKRLVLVLVAAVALVGPGKASAAWNCSPGFCSWGFNHVTSTVNQYVPSPWNYWWDDWVDKNSGDWIRHGFNSQTSGQICNWYLYGVAEAYKTLADAGCGGYNQIYVGWYSGWESYLYTDTTT